MSEKVDKNDDTFAVVTVLLLIIFFICFEIGLYHMSIQVSKNMCSEHWFYGMFFLFNSWIFFIGFREINKKWGEYINAK